jgi:hypothetical protein
VRGFLRRALLPACAIAVLLLVAPGASAAPSGRYKGGDIEFRVSQNRIKKISILSYHTCQRTGTGEFFNELQRFTPRGGFRIGRGGSFSGSRYVMRVNDYFDIRFAWVGRFRGGRMRTKVQTMYKYYDPYSPGTIISCFSEKSFSATRRG